MSLKLKHLFPIFALALGIGTALLVSRVKAFAADGNTNDDYPNDGITYVTRTDNNFTVYFANFNGYSSFDYFATYLDPNDSSIVYSNYNTTSDIYLTYNVLTRTPLFGQFANGAMTFTFQPTVKLVKRNGYVFYNTRYSVNIEQVNFDDDIGISLNRETDGNYTIGLRFNDFYCGGTARLSFTLHYRISAYLSFSGSTISTPLSVPIRIDNTNTSINFDSLSLSSVSKQEIMIGHAIDRSENVQEIVDQLTALNAHMVWSDGSVVYDIADLLWMLNGNQMTGNSTAQNILNTLTTDTSGITTQANNEINQAHTSELTAQNDMQNVLVNIRDGTYVTGPNTQVQVPDFQEGLAQIASGVTNGRDFINNNGKAIQFWTYVGDTLLDRSHFGYIASFLCIVLVLGFTVWVLKL